MESNNKYRLPTKMLVIFAVMVLIYALGAVFAYNYVERSLFYERSANVNILMEKIVQNVQTGLNNRWNTLHALSHELAETEFSSKEEAQAALSQKIAHRHEAISALFFIDAAGSCYTNTDDVFLWPAMDMLTDAERQVYVSGDILPGGSTEIFFISRLPRDVVIDGYTMTHLALACDTRFIDAFFDVSEFGGRAAAFIIDRSGTQVYREDTDNPLSGVRNVLSALYSASFHYGSSHEQLVADVANGTDTCVSLEYGDKEYYLVYYAMPTNDWTAMILIPEETVGSASRMFIQAIIVAIVAICLGGLTIVMSILITTSHSVDKQRRKVNHQLQRAMEAERSANEAKTKFLSSMSHDIRTPMNAIIGMTTLASNHLDDPAYMKNCLSKVSLASNHLLTLINDVLDISKVESGSMSLNPIVFDLAETVNNLINIVRPQVTAKGHRFEMRIHNVKHEQLFADQLRINQIFINLLSNAVKYTPEGGCITVDIRQDPVFGAADRVRITYIVEDTGVGMSPQFQKTMYQAFARAHSDQIDTIQGTGLGLAICKQMVDLMGGTIECDSEVGRGTKFTVRLVLPIAEKLTDNLMLPPMQVLLVDDDPVFLESAANTLLELGLHADCVNNGEAAVERVVDKHEKGNDYPVVIIDWQMPGMDGIETTRAIRRRVGPDVPIIIISAYERTEVEALALEAGANGFISKPFFKSTVYRDINAILNLVEESGNKAGEHSADSLRGMHILIAEDNELNWEIASSILEMYGVTTVRAVNGRDCVQKLKAAAEGEYQLVLMDIQMPVMDGYEAARTIRSDEARHVRAIPIVAMTADAFADDIQRCVAAGMNGHIAKPIDVPALISMLEKIRGGVT